MQPKILFIIIGLLSFQHIVSAQQRVLLTDFRFIVNDTQEFPNYFEDETLTKTIYEKGLDFVRKKLNIGTIETYQAKEIEYRFRPPFRDNLNIIDREEHHLFVSITSSAGIHTDDKGAKTYIIYSKVRIENNENDTLFLNKSHATFTLEYSNSVLYDEAVIGKDDFKNLFINLLENTFLDSLDYLNKEFTKPSIVAYNGFMNKAEKILVSQEDKVFSQRFTANIDSLNRRFITIKSQPISIDGTIKIQDIADILRFEQHFVLKNNLAKKRYRIKGYYEEATDYETKVRYIKSTKLLVKNLSNNYILEFYPDKETSWVYTLDWQVSETDKYTLLANRYTNYMEIFSDNGLLAIIQLPSSGVKLLEIKNKQYTFYYKSNLSQNTKADIDYLFAFFIIANQFMAEVNIVKQAPLPTLQK